MASIAEHGNDKNKDYELVDHQESDEAQQYNSRDDGYVNHSLRLPPKALSPRRSLRPFAISAVFAFVFIIGMIVLLHYLPQLIPDTSSSYGGDEFKYSCDLTVPTNSTMENAFMINLRSAQQLSFGWAKLIDVTWDLLVGQGGRLVMAWAAYRVFMDGLVSLMETTPVSYELYASLVFDTTSLLSTWKATKALIQSKSWRSRMFAFWFCISTFYILSFTTLMSAATGYVNPSQPGYNVPDGSFVLATSEKLRACISLYAGALIGEKNGTIITGPKALGPTSPFDPSSSEELNEKYPDYYFWISYYPEVYVNGTSVPPYSSYYLSNYTSNITWHNRTYTFHNFTLEQGFFWNTGYCYTGNETVPIDPKDISSCMPEDNDFVWGFSSVLLQVILYLQIAWTFIMLFIWLHANMTSQLLFKKRQMRGHFRATADLAEAVKDVLGDEICAYSDEEMKRQLKLEKRGLRYYTAENSDKGTSHIGLGGHGSLGLDDSRLYGTRRRRTGEEES